MFAKPIDSITFEDVEAFCRSGVREGIVLDFKKDFPTRLNKAIAAFANTYGGLLLIGVDENPATGQAAIPICGVQLMPGLRERVVRTALDGIYPPVIPETRVVEFKSQRSRAANDRAVVIVRVHESEMGSHAVDKRTTVYLRVDNVSDPYRKATVEEVEWFLNKRQKAVDEKGRIVDLVDGHAQYYLSQLRVKHGLPSTHALGRLVFWAVPTFPRTPIAQPEQLLAWNRQRRYTLPFTGQTFPSGNVRPTKDGVYFDGDYERRYVYTEVQRQGLVYHECGFWWDEHSEVRRLVYPVQVAERIYYGLHHAVDLYEEFAYFGLMDFRFQLRGVRGRRMGVPSDIELGSQGAADDTLNFEVRHSVSEVREDLLRIAKSIQTEIYWAFGEQAASETVDRDFARCNF